MKQCEPLGTDLCSLTMFSWVFYSWFLYSFRSVPSVLRRSFPLACSRDDVGFLVLNNAVMANQW